MKHKQKTRAWLLSLAAVVLLMCNTEPLKTEEPLKLKWQKDGLSFERICKPGKLVVASDYLLDLTNGEVIYRRNPDSNDLGIYPNYYGDKFYVFDYVFGRTDNYLREYDTKTRQFLGKYLNADHPMSPNEETGWYYTELKSFIFRKAFTRELIDSIYYPINLKIINQKPEFTNDSRYFATSLIVGLTPYFYLYDRSTREFLFEGKKNFKYCLFNKSNKMAYAENLKLDGDDTIYSYIRIYDPDQRKVIQNIKIAKTQIIHLINRMDDKFVIYLLDDGKNTERIYDYENNKIIDYDLRPIGSPNIYFDDTLLVTGATGGIFCNLIDVVLNVGTQNKDVDTIIYPNPTNNMLNLSISNDYFGGLWNISDINGKIYNKGIILPMPNLQIDVSRLNTGNYYLTLLKDKLIKTFKIVKQ